eukprot:g20744.t1
MSQAIRSCEITLRNNTGHSLADWMTETTLSIVLSLYNLLAARELEAGGQPEEALEAFQRALAVQKLVHAFDDRCKNNPKVKELVGERIALLEGEVQRLDPAMQATPIDDLEARLRRLRD